jgi:hypothetical protein
MNAANDLTINKLRLSNAVENLPAVRIKMCRWVESLQVMPANIPPSAVLIVKQLVDPLPKRLNLSSSSARIDSTWERAVKNKLSEIYQQAARPKLGLVPANSVAVVFSDESEMLAYLTLDLIRGEAVGHWWWRAFLRNTSYSASEQVTRLLCERPTQIPAILHELAERGQAQTLVTGLSTEQVFRLLMVMLNAYELPDFRQEMRNWSPLSAIKPDLSNDLPVSATASHLATEMPWNHCLPSGFIPAHWSKDKACLLGVGLTLYSAPAAVRSDAFLQKLRQWWAAPAPEFFEAESATTPISSFNQQHAKDLIEPLSQSTLETTQAAPEQTSFIDGSQNTLNLALPAQTLESLEPTESATVQNAQPYFTESQVNSVDEALEPVAFSAIESATVQNPQPYSAESPANRLSIETNTALPEAPELKTLDESPTASVSESNLQQTSSIDDADSDTAYQPDLIEKPLSFEGGVDTQLGGVLYLINLMAQLDLPQCFEQEWRLASQLGAWGVLDILARALLDEPSESLYHDPLWQVLAALNGREVDELPGVAFQGGECFYLPAAWLKYVGDDANGAYAWSTDGDRYCLWSEQGYVLAEDSHSEPLTALNRYFNDVSVNLSQQSYDKTPIAKLSNPLLSGLNPDLSHWLALVMPYLRLRLQQALRGAVDLNALLLHSGRLYLTSTHVDLVLSLNNVSIPIRIAGLDLDPGWMPDFGRIVLFHYE